MVGDTKKGVCVCVRERERERERVNTTFSARSISLFKLDLFGRVETAHLPSRFERHSGKKNADASKNARVEPRPHRRVKNVSRDVPSK